MAKRGRRKKSRIDNKDISVVILIALSILLGVLIYTKSGYLGEHLSPMLGGIIGFIKYIVPVGTFVVAISIVYDDKKYIYSKLIQYIIFLLCIMIITDL